MESHEKFAQAGFFFFCGSTGVCIQGLHLELLYQPFFVMGFFREIFSWAGLEL
jgi:hypothetical protein